MTSFINKITNLDLQSHRKETQTLQINLGKLCNQVCMHCHVGAGPNSVEIMTMETIERLLQLIEKDPNIKVVDLTGGAPELNPHFKYLVQKVHEMGKSIIDRCNLTVLYEPNQEDTAQFLADHKVVITASMPCYLEENVNNQRGDNVYEKSISALKQLNALGYGKEGTELVLNLVFNPSGMGLPPEQASLEADYKQYLKESFGIEFNQLLTIANMPIKRFKEHLKKTDKLADYEQLLVEKFNPEAAERIMCRGLISIGWDGKLYDCDFNQALDIQVQSKRTIWDIEALSDVDREISFDNHCYGCTAGSGSSCGGALI